MKRILFFLFLILIVFIAYQSGLADYLNFTYLKNHLNEFQRAFAENPFKISVIFFLVYVFTTAVSFPGASLLTLLAGAVFGFFYSAVLVSFASTIGATLAFFSSRFLFSNFLHKKFPEQFQTINKNLEKNGPYYLLTLRLIPVFPFFVVNLLLGLTNIRTSLYFIYSQLGMLPATLVYLYAGKKFAEIKSPGEVFSPKIIAAFFLLGIVPTIGRWITELIGHRRLYKKFKKPKSFDYNMIVIGGGSAGLVTAYISSAVKAKVALIEADKMGGDCLNTGCIPSKALIQSAKAVHFQTKARQLGLKNIAVEFDFKDIMSRVKRVVTSVEPHDSRARYESLGVECIEGFAKIISPYEVLVNGKILTTRNITIATGARPLVPQLPGLVLVTPLTSNNLWNLESLPENFLIIGGGPIGCELAQCFARLGSKVTIVEGGERILAKEDPSVSALMTEILQKEGITIYTKTKAQKFELQQNLKYLVTDSSLQIAFDEVLFAVGRKATVKGFGLEELGVEISKSGTLETNEFMQTNFPNIFACGDVAGPYQFTHTASHQAWYCAVNGLFGRFKKFKVDYSVVPWCTFTDPEIAVVGSSEKELKEKHTEFETTVFSLEELDRAIADDQTKGFVKVFTKKNSDRILGAVIVSAHASTMILEFISAMKFKKGLNDLMSTIHIYPTFGEANKYAAGVWKKNHAPERVLNLTRKYFNWMRR